MEICAVYSQKEKKRKGIFFFLFNHVKICVTHSFFTWRLFIDNRVLLQNDTALKQMVFKLLQPWIQNIYIVLYFRVTRHCHIWLSPKNKIIHILFKKCAFVRNQMAAGHFEGGFKKSLQVIFDKNSNLKCRCYG